MLQHTSPEPNPTQQQWYFCHLSAINAGRKLLLPENQNGAFLVRRSANHPKIANGYVLCVRTNNSVNEWAINQDRVGFYFIGLHTFRSIPELLEYYKHSEELGVKLTVPCHVDEWEIHPNSLKPIQKLGEGSFGQVYACYFTVSPVCTIAVAVKKIKNGTTDYQQFLNEVQILKCLQHPFILKLIGVCTQREPLIVTELHPNGDLRRFLEKHHCSLTLEARSTIATQIAFGMAYLESRKIIHRDLAARNILVSDNLDIKIADFGMARAVTQKALANDEVTYVYEARDRRCPIRWTAPEALYGSIYSCKSDVWSYGMVLYEIWTAKVPYSEFDDPQVIKLVRSGYVMPCLEGCQKEIYNTMLLCWKHNPVDRPTFNAIVQGFKG